jgi:hypothetical protein
VCVYQWTQLRLRGTQHCAESLRTIDTAAGITMVGANENIRIETCILNVVRDAVGFLNGRCCDELCFAHPLVMDEACWMSAVSECRHHGIGGNPSRGSHSFVSIHHERDEPVSLQLAAPAGSVSFVTDAGLIGLELASALQFVDTRNCRR